MEDEKRSKSRSDGELCAIDTVCNDNEQSNGCTTIYIYMRKSSLKESKSQRIHTNERVAQNNIPKKVS